MPVANLCACKHPGWNSTRGSAMTMVNWQSISTFFGDPIFRILDEAKFESLTIATVPYFLKQRPEITEQALTKFLKKYERDCCVCPTNLVEALALGLARRPGADGANIIEAALSQFPKAVAEEIFFRLKSAKSAATKSDIYYLGPDLTFRIHRAAERATVLREYLNKSRQ